MIGGCLEAPGGACSSICGGSGQPKASSMRTREDWEMSLPNIHAVPLAGSLKEPYPGLAHWLETALQPLVAEAQRIRVQLRNCEARLEELTSGAVSLPRVVQGSPLQVDGQEGRLIKDLRQQLNESSQAEASLGSDAFQAVAALETQLACALQSVSEVRSTQQAMRGDLEALREQIVNGDNELDFGAPIGKTLNTQDYAMMNAELKTELRTLSGRLDELAIQRKDFPGSPASVKSASLLQPIKDPKTGCIRLSL